MKDAAHDRGPRLHRHVHAELLHPLEVGCVQLVAVDERPAQVLDRVLLVDLLDLIEEAVGRALERGVRVNRHPGLRDFARDSPPLHEVLLALRGFRRNHVVAGGPVEPFAVGERIDPQVTLEQLEVGNLRQPLGDALRGRPHRHRHQAVEPLVQFSLLRPLRVGWQHVVGARAARGGQPDGIQLADHGHAVGLEVPLVRLRDRARHPAGACGIDDAGRTAARVTLDEGRRSSSRGRSPRSPCCSSTSPHA